MESPECEKITRLLQAWGAGDRAAEQELIPLVYTELRQLASRYRQRAGSRGALQTTELVNEAYLRLVNIHTVDWRDRVHFFAVSAQLMRRILIDSARMNAAAKRGGLGQAVKVAVNWDDIAGPDAHRAEDLIALDEALTRLTMMDNRQGQVVQLRVFGGLTVEETSEALGLSAVTVMRDWKVAKAWLLRELSRTSRSEMQH
jgi:RNA polymerase sigma factor (TIGR02999 family)